MQPVDNCLYNLLEMLSLQGFDTNVLRAQGSESCHVPKLGIQDSEEAMCRLCRPKGIHPSVGITSWNPCNFSFSLWQGGP